MRKKILFILMISIIIILFYKRQEIVFFIEHNQHRILNLLKLQLKRKYLREILALSLFYGILHGIQPGHGKINILKLMEYKNTKSILTFIIFIGYMQGIVSYILTKSIVTSMSRLKFLDYYGYKIYGILFFLFVIFDLLGGYVHLKKKYYLLSVAFFPCTGVITILIISNLLHYSNYMFFIAMAVSTGVTLTLLAWYFLSINLKFGENILKFKFMNSIGNIIYIIIGSYLLFL